MVDDFNSLGESEKKMPELEEVRVKKKKVKMREIEKDRKDYAVVISVL